MHLSAYALALIISLTVIFYHVLSWPDNVYN